MSAERQLASELGYPCSILREAIEKLISEGVLVSPRGGSSYVCYEKQPWSEYHLVQPLKIRIEDDPSYRLVLKPARTGMRHCVVTGKR